MLLQKHFVILHLLVEFALLITTDKNEKYANAFKVLDNGLYVNTCSDTKTKYSQIQQINNKLNLGLIIELI